MGCFVLLLYTELSVKTSTYGYSLNLAGNYETPCMYQKLPVGFVWNR